MLVDRSASLSALAKTAWEVRPSGPVTYRDVSFSDVRAERVPMSTVESLGGDGVVELAEAKKAGALASRSFPKAVPSDGVVMFQLGMKSVETTSTVWAQGGFQILLLLLCGPLSCCFCFFSFFDQTAKQNKYDETATSPPQQQQQQQPMINVRLPPQEQRPGHAPSGPVQQQNVAPSAQPFVQQVAVSQPLPTRIEAFQFPRFVGAVIIVVGHFYRGPYRQHCGWAFSIVNFFFILAGLLPAMSKLVQEWPPLGKLRILPIPRTLLRRCAATYPPYLSVLLLEFAGAVATGFNGQLPIGQVRKLHWLELGAEATLTQTWFPSYFRPARVCFNTPAWFVSVLAAFWVLEEATFSLVALFWRSGHLLLLTSAFFLTWPLTPFSEMFTFLFPQFKGGYLSLLADTPLRYYPQYLSGVALAFILRQGTVPHNAWSGRVTGAIILGLFLVPFPFATVYDVIDRGEFMADLLLKECGIMTPLFCVHLLALANGADPLAQWLAMYPLPWLGDLSYVVYISQGLVHVALNHLPVYQLLDGNAKVAVLLTCLLPFAILLQKFIQEPAGRFIYSLGRK
jgi:peptidoglycan/LPS O-acetylase OafA/YrhL